MSARLVSRSLLRLTRPTTASRVCASTPSSSPSSHRSFSSQTLYTARVHTQGARTGTSRLEDGNLTLHLARPVAIGGDGKGTNPEELFAAAYSSCFQGAMGLVARTQFQKTLPSESSIAARCSLLKSEDGKMSISVSFDISVPGWSREEAEKVVAAAHQVCPYSSATRGNVPVTLNVV